MRNYTTFFWAKISYDVDVNPPNPVVPEKDFVMAPDEIQLATLIQETIAGLVTDPRVQNVRPELKGKLWFLMDKTNLWTLLAAAGNDAMQLIDQGTFPPYIFNPAVGDTPRDGWTDEDGEKREATPSDKATKAKGSKTVPTESLLQALETFAGALIARGYKTGKGTLLTQLIGFIQAVRDNRPFDMAALSVLLTKISQIA